MNHIEEEFRFYKPVSVNLLYFFKLIKHSKLYQKSPGITPETIWCYPNFVQHQQ